MISNGELNFRYTNLLDARLVWQEVNVENLQVIRLKVILETAK